MCSISLLWVGAQRLSSPTQIVFVGAGCQQRLVFVLSLPCDHGCLTPQACSHFVGGELALFLRWTKIFFVLFMFFLSVAEKNLNQRVTANYVVALKGI